MNMVVLPKKVKSVDFLKLIIYFSMFFGILHDFFKLPGLLLFINDFALILCLLISLRKKTKWFSKSFICCFLLSYLIFVVFAYIFNYDSIFHLLFGLRNNFRYYLFFLLCIKCFGKKDIDKILDSFEYIFYINAVLMVIQRFVFGYEQDLLGGIFGISYGCNGSLNIFLIIITARTLIKTLDKTENISSCVIKCALSLFLAALSELKIYFFEFVVILAFAVLVTRFSLRKLIVIIGSFLGIIIGVNFLVKLYPGFEGFFSIEGARNIVAAGSYSDSNAFNRFTFVTYINRFFFTNKLDMLFGFGLGNCELSSISLFDTNFYHYNGWMHYDWFHSTFTYFEQGLIGLIYLVSFFVIVIISLFLMRKKYAGNDKENIMISIVCACLSIVLIFYNQSLRTESGYLMYFIISIPFNYTTRRITKYV